MGREPAYIMSRRHSGASGIARLQPRRAGRHQLRPRLLELEARRLLASITEYPIPTGSSYPQGIAAGPDGALWFTEQIGNNIGRITTAGVVTEYPIPTAGSQPIGIVAGPDGALWFTQRADRIGRIAMNGAITEFTVPTAKASPYGIATAADGTIWFTEQASNKIGKLTPAPTVTVFA